MTLTGGELFAGIGGFTLAMKAAGITPVYAVEIDERCQEVLRLRHPELQVFGDVRSVGANNLPRVDLIAGGFPCQNISQAGKGAGIEGEQSRLWFEYARIIRELRPRYVLVENVPILRSRGLNVVLGDLAACGYDAEWDCVSAASVGAPHLRERIWIVAYRQGDAPRPNADRPRSHRASIHIVREAEFRDEQERESRPMGEALADTHGESTAQRGQRADAPSEGAGRGDDRGRSGDVAGQERLRGSGQGARDVADADFITGRARGPGDAGESPRGRNARGSSLSADDVEDSDSGAVLTRGRWWRAAQASDARDWWRIEPGMGRVADGVPDRVDRLTELGNALVPQVAEIFTRCIAEHAAMRDRTVNQTLIDGGCTHCRDGTTIGVSCTCPCHAEKGDMERLRQNLRERVRNTYLAGPSLCLTCGREITSLSASCGCEAITDGTAASE